MIQSIERGIEILRLLETGPLGVTELANATALPKTTVHRLLKTFEAHHWVEFNRDKKYQLSWGVLPMAKVLSYVFGCACHCAAIHGGYPRSVAAVREFVLGAGRLSHLYRARCGG